MSDDNDSTVDRRNQLRQREKENRQKRQEQQAEAARQRAEKQKERHKDKCRENVAEKRANRLASGLCPRCGGERESTEYQLCNACREKKRKNDADNMERGLCRNCGGQREDSTVQHCNKCRKAQRVTGLSQRYSLTVEDYDRMFAEQNGVCWICRKPEVTNNGTLHIDHDSKSGKVRGLLCGNCNRGIGCLDHSLELLERAIEYLKVFNS